MEKVLIEIEMENGDVMKGELYPEVCTNYCRKSFKIN